MTNIESKVKALEARREELVKIETDAHNEIVAIDRMLRSVRSRSKKLEDFIQSRSFMDDSAVKDLKDISEGLK